MVPEKKERGKCPLSDNNRKVASVNICEKKLPREDFFSIGKCIKHLSSNEMLMFLYYTYIGTNVQFMNKNFMLFEMNSQYQLRKLNLFCEMPQFHSKGFLDYRDFNYRGTFFERGRPNNRGPAVLMKYFADFSKYY